MQAPPSASAGIAREDDGARMSTRNAPDSDDPPAASVPRPTAVPTTVWPLLRLLSVLVEIARTQCGGDEGRAS